MKTRLLTCWCAAAALAFATAYPQPLMAQDTTVQPAANSQDKSVSKDDQKFLDTVWNANTYGVQSSERALKSSNNEKIKEFAKTMIKDHTGANEAVAKLAGDVNAKLPKELNDQFRKMINDLEGKEGEEFDKAYASAHLKLHKTAVDLFDKTSKEGDNAQVKKFASTVLPTLQHHLHMAKQLPGNENSGSDDK